MHIEVNLCGNETVIEQNSEDESYASTKGPVKEKNIDVLKIGPSD